MNILYIDTETTGLNPKTCSIIQIAGILKTSEEEIPFNFKMRPYRGERMSKVAQEKTGYSTAEVYTFPDQDEVFSQFLSLLKKHIKSYNEKAYLIGYNISFDGDFLREWFSFNNENWGYLTWFPYIDVMSLAGLYLVGARPLMKNFKLTTVYNMLLGHDFENAHDAMADIRATKEIFELVTQKMLFHEGAARDLIPPAVS